MPRTITVAPILRLPLLLTCGYPSRGDLTPSQGGTRHGNFAFVLVDEIFG